MATRLIGRNAGNGRFISVNKARKLKDTSVVEKIKISTKKKKSKLRLATMNRGQSLICDGSEFWRSGSRNLPGLFFVHRNNLLGRHVHRLDKTHS